jgi:hypothetical protein
LRFAFAIDVALTVVQGAWLPVPRHLVDLERIRFPPVGVVARVDIHPVPSGVYQR